MNSTFLSLLPETWLIKFFPRLLAVCSQHPFVHMHDHKGNLINVQPLPQKLYGFNSYNGRRGEIHDILMNYAKKLGVDIRFDQNVESYWECSKSGRAGVIVNGSKIEGDVVVGADGARSFARKMALVREFSSTPKISIDARVTAGN